ncbi:MAG TPA: glycosyltransferase family 4 protein [bacterium]|nr:glycosyltransferase family 4 protein [bacterium]
MIKIAFIGQKGIPVSQGGVETHVEELSVRLAKIGHDVIVYTRTPWVPKEYKKYEQVHLISLPSLKTKNLDAITHSFLAVFHAIFKEKVDIIHFQGVGPSLLSWLPKILSRKTKVVATVHSADWEHQKWSFFAKNMLKLGARFACLFADDAIAVSRSLQNFCLANYRGAATYIPNGVSIPEKNNAQSEKILKAFNLEKNKYLLVVSRLVKHKGIHYLIEAFKDIKSNKKFAAYKLVIVGSTAFTEDYQKFLLTLTRGRSDIVFTGVQTGANLDVLFRHSYLYVQPSESEGLSIAILEAMSYGKSILVSNIPENFELISGNTETGAVGFDFENKNVIDLTKKIIHLLNEPRLVHQVGLKAKNYVRLYYNWEEITYRTEKIYRNIIKIKDKLKQAKSRLLVIEQKA